MGVFITRGADADAFDMEKTWTFEPQVAKGDEVASGQVIGHVQETETIVHKIMVPPGKGGKVKSIESGDFNVTQTVCVLEDGTELQMMQKWPGRSPRPYTQKYAPDTPLRPECAFWTSCSPRQGRCSSVFQVRSGPERRLQQLFKLHPRSLVVYIGCGERGNEMTEVLDEFPHRSTRTRGSL